MQLFTYFKKSSLLVLLCTMSMVALAQRNIKGNITDGDNGEALIGASVLVVGTSIGTVSDYEGNFSLSVPADAKELNISYTGYTAQTIPLTAEIVYNISLKSGIALNDVVIIGYGTQKKKDLTGSITNIGEKDFQKGNIVTPEQLIVGKVAGVQITSNSGAPGSGSRIRIRGGASLNANNDPLIVIDGVPLDNGSTSGAANPLSFINPNDIESYTVLKDASATAIYGSRASNGVIIIKTKSGKAGDKLRVNFSSVTSVANKVGIIDVLSAQQFRDTILARGTNAQKNLLGKDTTVNTNWQNEIFQQAISSDNNLSVNGAIKNFPYRVSLGYLNQNGILRRSNLNRFSTNVNLSPSFFGDYLRFNVGVKSSLSRSLFADEGSIGSAVRFDPTQRVRTDSTAYNGYFEWLQPNGKPEQLAPRNPVALLELKDDKSTVWRNIYSAQVDYRFHFLPALRANLNVALDKTDASGTVDMPATAAAAFNKKGVGNYYEQQKTNKLLESYLNYSKDYNSIDSKIDFTLGYSYQDFIYQDSSIERSETQVAPDTTIIYAENYYKRQNTLVSFFGRAIYTFKDRYILTYTQRRDGSSRFSPDSRWGWFPSAALAWRVSDEAFLKGSSVVSDLKFRVGVGNTGQQDVFGDYPYLPRITLSEPTAQYPFGDTYYTTARPEGYDANIKWESTTTYNAGIDFGLFGDRITGSVDYYIKETKDLLSEIPVPAGSNLTNRILTNVGNIRNNGIEVSLNTIPVKSKDFMWEFNINATFNKNEITNLSKVPDADFIGIPTGGISGGVGNNIQIHSVGYPTNSFFVYEQVYDEAGKPLENQYVDRNGDGTVTPEDRYHFESPNAQVFLGTSSTFSYKNLSLGFVMRANLGNYVYNNIYSGSGAYNNLTNGSKSLANVSSNVLETNFKNNQYFSDYYVEDASFVRLDNVSVGYVFKKLIKDRLDVRLSLLAQNVFVASKYRGLDPELANGIDNNVYPRPRTFSLGVNVDF